MSAVITTSRKVTPNKVESVLSIEKDIFNVTSIFDKNAALVDLLFMAAIENLCRTPFFPGDISLSISYNGKDDD